MLLDSLLLEDSDGRQKFTEGRGVFFCKLKRNHKHHLLSDLPTNAHYIRACIKAFWELNIQQDLTHPDTLDYVGAESPWLNSRLPESNITHANRKYYGSVIDVKILSDIMDKTTNQLFTETQWRYWIQKLDKEHLERNHLGASNRARGITLLYRWAKKLQRYINESIPHDIVHALQQPQIAQPRHGHIYALIRPDSAAPVYARYEEAAVHDEDVAVQARYVVQWIDALGAPHETAVTITTRRDDPGYIPYEPYEISWWRHYSELQKAGRRELDERIRGPSNTTFPKNTGWRIDNEPIILDAMTIKKITWHFTQRRFKPPVGTQTCMVRQA